MYNTKQNKCRRRRGWCQDSFNKSKKVTFDIALKYRYSVERIGKGKETKANELKRQYSI